MQAETEIPLPEFEEILSAAGARPDDDETRFRQFTAAVIAAASLLLGLIGNLLFYGSPIGINVFLYGSLFSIAAFTLLFCFQRPVIAKHAVFIIPALSFALLLGVRLAPQLILFNTMMMLGSLLIVIHFVGVRHFLGEHWSDILQRTVETIAFGWLKSLQDVVPDSLHWFGQTELDNQQLANVKSALRGLLITLPVVIVFTLLLSSADAVFSDLAERTISLFLPESGASVIGQTLLVSILTLGSLTAFWTMLNRSSDAPSSLIHPLQRKTQRFRLNIIETSTVLGSVNLLFTAFVIIQARYLFGGTANINTQGYTYAEYARRGFYELLAVSFMTMLLLVTLDSLTYRKREEENIFRGLVVLIIALTFVILIAAFRRLDLYENAYGYTRIRVMSGAFIVWLALLLGALLAAILRHQRELFQIGCLITALGFALTLNLMNMDGFIARHNIERFEDTGKLDIAYLLSLSDDAIPTVAALVDHTDLDGTQRDHLLYGLQTRLYALDRDHNNRDLFSYHIGQARAWRALDSYRDILQSYGTR